MSYNALVAQILLSAPSDLDASHRRIVLDVTRAWNADHGRVYGVHFSIVDWKDNAAAGTGEYAQGVLNEQIVEESDAAIVVFSDRMGTPTPSYPSGTAEEIDQLLTRGRDVAVLRNNCPRRVPENEEQIDQKEALEEYVQTLYSRALVKTYDTSEGLRREVVLVLNFLARKHRREADAGLHQEVGDEEPGVPSLALSAMFREEISEGVWPRLEVTETPEMDSKGRVKHKRRWRLVLESTSAHPVSDVAVRFEDGEGNVVTDFDLGRTSGPIARLLAPRATVERPLLQAWQSRSDAMCVVTWTDHLGEARETRASIRTH